MTDGCPRIRVYVAEDEKPAIEAITSLVEADPELDLVGVGFGETALAEVLSLAPDLLLLDVRMPVLDGFQLLRSIPEEEVPDVVFITAFDEYAVEAFEVRALDYLLKPFTDQRFRESIRRAKARVRSGERSGAREVAATVRVGASEPAAVKVRRDRLVLEEGARTLLLPIEEIEWIEASGTYSTVHVGRAGYLVRITMSELEQRLLDSGFFRIHRSSIVNLRTVREVRTLSHGDGIVVLDNGTKLRLARSRREQFVRALGR